MTENIGRSFDNIWPMIDSTTLKRFARGFGGKITLRKEECVAFMKAAMKDQLQLKTRVAALPRYEQNMLAIIKFFGGEIERTQLKLALDIAGIKLPARQIDYIDPFDDVMSTFLNTGLAFNHSTFGTLTSLSRYSGGTDLIFSDPRVLECVPMPDFQPIEAQPVPAPQTAVSRSPRLISMQMIGVLHAIESLHGLKLTKGGEVRATELRKLAKILDWKDDSLVEGDLTLPYATTFSISILRAAGMLEPQNNLLMTSALSEAFTGWAVEKQVQTLLQAFLQIEGWYETERIYIGYYPQNLKNGRFALCTLLRCLPANEPAFYKVDDFDQTLFQRIGGYFRLLHITPRFRDYDRDQRAMELKYTRWLNKQRSEWLKIERMWIEECLKTWLYFLGMVTLELKGELPQTIALSDLGRAVLHPELKKEPATDNAAAGQQPPWIIQPNFDVVVYLDHLSNAQLAFLERNADRLRTNEHMAEYHISRESTYRGLESGATLEQILADWQSGSSKELPQNVMIELNEWASQRDRIAIYRTVDLAEFPDENSRQAALQKGILGTPVGDRFLLIEQPLSRAQLKSFYAIIDYASPPVRCLSIEEDGLVAVSEHMDLLLDAQLNEWTDPLPDGRRRFTRASVQRSIRTGRPITALYRLLENRISRIIPPIMQIALRAWAGADLQIGMGNVLLLYSPSADVSYAIQNSALLKPYLRGMIAPGYFLVDTNQVEALKAQLTEFGLDAQSVLISSRH